MRHRASSRRRRGISLFETVSAVATVAVALSAISVTWHLLTRLHRKTEQALDEVRQVERLALQFRLDAREAVDAAAVEEAGGESVQRGWNFRCRDGRTIEYRQTAQGIQRHTKLDAQREHRELYRLPEGANVKFAPPSEVNRHRTTLAFHHRGEERLAADASRAASPKEWLIVAARIDREGSAP